jgi:hypothetical protein
MYTTEQALLCPARGAARRFHFAVNVRHNPRAFATVLLIGILPDSMALTLARSILRRLAQAAWTAIAFNCGPQQADDIFLIKYDARATEVGDRSCAF